MGTFKFPDLNDPDCHHRSHYECVTCRKIVCARCGVEMAEASQRWKTLGWWCETCLRKDEPKDEVKDGEPKAES